MNEQQNEALAFRICEPCDGCGQDNDGESFINEPCPKCKGGGHFAYMKDYDTEKSRADGLAKELEDKEFRWRLHNKLQSDAVEECDKLREQLAEKTAEVERLKTDALFNGPLLDANAIADQRDALREQLATAELERDLASRDAGLYCASLALSANQLGCEPEMVEHAVEKVLGQLATARTALDSLRQYIENYANEMDELMNRPPDFSRGQRIARMIGQLVDATKNTP